jgi:hypothetical protein
MKMVATTVIALFVFSFPAFATGPVPDIFINGGTMDFQYNQTGGPGGPISGSFSSDGVLAHDPPNEGTAATTYVLDGVNYATVVGAIEDGANYTDGAVIVVSDPTNPIMVGTYDLDGTVGVFAFVDDAFNWFPPTDLWKTNWTEELLLIDAAGKYGSTSGTVTFTHVEVGKVAGTFECTATYPETGVVLAITFGSFNADGLVATDRASWSSIKALYR